MKTCEYAGQPFTEPRTHPWSDSVASPDFRYYDLRAEPALIRTALEDFVPWAGSPAIEAFYALLERLNGAGSPLETTDCAFTGPHHEADADPAYACDGRVIVMFRELTANLSRERVAAFATALHRRLAAIDPALVHGMIGTTLLPAQFVQLPRPAAEQHGVQLMISFWAWGESELEVLTNLHRVVRNLARALG